MVAKFSPSSPSSSSSSSPFPVIPYLKHQTFSKIIVCSSTNSSSSSPPPPPSSDHKNGGFKNLAQSLGDSSRWKIDVIDRSAMQETLTRWVSKTQNFLTEVTSPLVKNVNDRNPNLNKTLDTEDMEELFMAEHTVDGQTPNGNLSLAAIVSIEQFSRMNGLTGKKMQKIFKALVPESVNNDARNLVEYCCFRYLSRDSSEIHPSLKDPTFQRLIFVSMLAWEHPYSNAKDSMGETLEKASFQKRLIEEAAFVRIAPAISGLADWVSVHNLYKALAGSEKGISYSVWSAYINELLKVHEGRKSNQLKEGPQLSGERILCLGSTRKRPVLRWENNMAWPGNLTLTDKALYFEAANLLGKRESIRMDLTRLGSRVEKTRVGPLGIDLFDSAVSVTSGSETTTLALEFVDLGGENRRDVWHAFINEVISLYKFIQDFGPKDGDKSIYNVYGAQKGKSRATSYAINGIARLQALQRIKRLLDEPTKLVPFSYLQNAPYGDIVCQTLAINCWGGPLTTKLTEGAYQSSQGMKSSDGVFESNVFDIDGSVYLRKWMRSPSWDSSASIAFWKSTSVRQAVVLSKNLVVADKNLIQKAAATCRDKYSEVEKTQATIDAAMIEGIPSNIDLFKEIVFPFTVTAMSLTKLKRWEEPHLTAAFLAFTYAIIFRNLLPYVFPTILMVLAASMLLLKALKEQGRLGRYLWQITIRDQPSSNTIEKIIALKEAMRDVEKYLQKLNVSLLKLRTILLAGQPQVTTEVALVLLLSSTVLLVIPFKYILSLFIFDQFTRELEFRKEMVIQFNRLIKERWDTVPAAPVTVLPFEPSASQTGQGSQRKQIVEKEKSEKTQNSSKSKSK